VNSARMSASQLGAALGLPRRSEPSQEGRAAVAAAARNVEKARIFSGGSPQHPLGGFVAADDFADTRELVAVIRGSDGGRRMYGVGDKLPAVYVERFRTQIYNERVVHPGLEQGRRRCSRGRLRDARHAQIRSRRRYRA
jgi:hypothetical protein